MQELWYVKCLEWGAVVVALCNTTCYSACERGAVLVVCIYYYSKMQDALCTFEKRQCIVLSILS